jgi:hypothetical protein
MTDEEKHGNIVNFDQIKKNIKHQADKLSAGRQESELQRLQKCTEAIDAALKEYNCVMVSVPRMEHLGAGVFRMLGELVLKVNPS